MKAIKLSPYGFVALFTAILFSGCSNPNGQTSKSSSSNEENQEASAPIDASIVKEALEKVDAAESSLKGEPEVSDASAADLEVYLVGEEEGTSDLKTSPGVAPAMKQEATVQIDDDGKCDRPGELACKSNGMIPPCGSNHRGPGVGCLPPCEAPKDASIKPPTSGPCSPLMLEAKGVLQEARKFHHELVKLGKVLSFGEIRKKIKSLSKSSKGEDLKKKIEEIVKAMLASLEKEKAEIKAAKTANSATITKLHELKFGVVKNCLPAHGFLGNKIEFVDRLCLALPKLDLCSKVSELKAAVDNSTVCSKSVKDLKDFITVSREKMKAVAPVPAAKPAEPAKP